MSLILDSFIQGILEDYLCTVLLSKVFSNQDLSKLYVPEIQSEENPSEELVHRFGI